MIYHFTYMESRFIIIPNIFKFTACFNFVNGLPHTNCIVCYEFVWVYSGEVSVIALPYVTYVPQKQNIFSIVLLLGSHNLYFYPICCICTDSHKRNGRWSVQQTDWLKHMIMWSDSNIKVYVYPPFLWIWHGTIIGIYQYNLMNRYIGIISMAFVYVRQDLQHPYYQNFRKMFIVQKQICIYMFLHNTAISYAQSGYNFPFVVDGINR